MAVPVAASTKVTAQRSVLVPLSWRVQVSPPSVLRTIIPRLPTATMVLASGADTPARNSPAGHGGCRYQPDWAELCSPSNSTRSSHRGTQVTKVLIVPPRGRAITLQSLIAASLLAAGA